MASKSDTFRSMVVKKGVLGLMVLNVVDQLERGLQLGAGGSRADSQAAAAIDSAWAI